MARKYIEWVPSPRTLKLISSVHTSLYRATSGRLGGRLDGLDILLLTTVGRRTGQRRTSPLPYFRDSERLVVIASNGGRDVHPAWFHNLCAEPRVTAQLGGRELSCHASILQEDERERVWGAITRAQPRYDSYMKTTNRRIPVVALEPL